jgi:hypothetical protein
MGGSSIHCTPQPPEVHRAITVVVPTLPQTAVLINGPATFDVTPRGRRQRVFGRRRFLSDTMDFCVASIG